MANTLEALHRESFRTTSAGIVVPPPDLDIPGIRVDGRSDTLPFGVNISGKTDAGLLIAENDFKAKETEQRPRQWILLNDFSNTDGGANDDFSPNQMVNECWAVRKKNNPDVKLEQPLFRDNTIVGLRPVNADYRAWEYSRMAAKIDVPYVMTVVCDPGVGGKREGIVIKTKQDNYLVGPNNGIFGRLLEDEGIAVGDDGRLQVWKVQDKIFDDVETSTFHGKDVFAPLSGELLDGKEADDLSDWLVPFNEKIRLNPFGGDFRSLVPEHASDGEREQVFIPGDHQKLLEHDGVRLFRFGGQVPPDAVAVRLIVPNRDTGEPETVRIINVGASFVDEGPGTLMAYPGSTNPSGVKGKGFTEVASSMAVHKGEPTAADQLGLSLKDIGCQLVFQWLREGDNVKDTSLEAVLAYQWEDRGVPKRVLDPDGTVHLVYELRENKVLETSATVFNGNAS